MTDRDDIIDVLVRYATGIDSRDWTLLRTARRSWSLIARSETE